MTTPILPSRTNLDALPRRARLQYYTALLTTTLLTSISLTQTHPPIHPILIALLALYTFLPLRLEHEYHVDAARHNCSPAPHFPHDFLGIRFLVESIRALRKNEFLQQREGLMGVFGHTFFHDVVGEKGRCVATDDPQNVKAVLCGRFEDWGLPGLRARSLLPVLGTHSIFTTNGPEWQHSRAILRPAFVRDQISDLACVDRHVGKLVARIPADGRPFDLQAMFALMTTDSISDFMFGVSTDLQGGASEDGYKFAKCFDVAMGKMALRVRLGRLSLFWKDAELDACATVLRGFVRGFVEDVRGRDDGGRDARKYVFLDELMKSGESDEGICDHLLSIFTAGRDTTTSMLSYMFFELAQRPDIVANIRKEIDALGDENPTWEQLRNMRYLNWVLKEVLRLSPPVALNSREAVRDTILPRGGGVDGLSPVFIRAGTIVRYSPWTMHRRKDLFGEDAAEFRPERWETLRVTNEYIPFNAGPRICIGQQFALTQIALITVRLLQAFTFERRDDRPPIQKLGINLSMLHGCIVSATPVRPA